MEPGCQEQSWRWRGYLMKQTAKMNHILNVPASPHTPFDFSLQSQFFIWRLGEAQVVAPGSHGSCILWGVRLGWRLWTRSPEKHFIYKTDLTAQFVCNAEHSSHAPPPAVLWALITSLMPALPQRPLKWKWWMRSCQAPFPGWPWIHPLICYTASPDSDEHDAGIWQHPYSLQKGKKKKKEKE